MKSGWPDEKTLQRQAAPASPPGPPGGWQRVRRVPPAPVTVCPPEIGPPSLSADLLPQFDALIRRDPARRGLLSSEPELGPLCPGHLAAAATDLARSGTQVAILTGFYIPHSTPPAAETDGPPGAVFLASALQRAGIEARIITDELCGSAVLAAANAAGLTDDQVLVCPLQGEDWRADFFEHGFGSRLSHLIAIERVGPSHTPESLAGQPRPTPAPLEEFSRRVPSDSFGVCHNMRGHNIDAVTGDAHRLFEELPRYCPQARTIGIGDGGNEIGMGQIPWEDLVRRLPGEAAARIPCRIATDWTIVAGVSNWGGYALAAATLWLRGQAELLRDRTADQELQVLQQMVSQGPAVDGVTRQFEATMDGLPFLTGIQPWEGMRRLLGL